MAKTKGLYKRGNVWWLRYAGPDGEMHFESARTSSKKEAEVLLIQRRREVIEGKMPVPIKKIPNYSFRELAERYSDWARRQRSFRSKRCFIRQLVGTFGNCPLRSFNTWMFEQWQTRELSENKPATANRHLACLRHMFTKAGEWEMIQEEVLKRVRRVKLVEENNRRLRYLSKEEYQGLVNSSDGHLKPIVIVAANSGMRKREVLTLKWDNVDLKHGFILLDRTKNGERREVPINDPAREALQGMVRHLHSPYVFLNPKTGKPYGDIKKAFQSALKRVGIRDFTFHDLRHTFASHSVMAGVDLTALKEILGHKDIKMTQRYAHLAPSHKVKAVFLLQEALGYAAPQSENTEQKVYKTNKKGANQVG